MSLTSLDPTVAFVQSSDIPLLNHLLTPLLLLLTLIFELSSKIHDSNTPISYSVFRTPSKSFSYSSFSENYFNFRDLRLHYVDEGPRNSSVIFICLHGLPFSSHSFSKLIPILTQQGFRVIAPDLIGFGKSDKFMDYRVYSLESLHLPSLHAFRRMIEPSFMSTSKVFLLGHNWGSLLAGLLLKENPNYAQRLILLNTNNLPDGELDFSGRFQSQFINFYSFLTINSVFLLFRSSINALRTYFPLPLLFLALSNGQYGPEDLKGFLGPFPSVEFLGGVVSFPLMVPVFPSDRYAKTFSQVRHFMSTNWSDPTLILYSRTSTLPFVEELGDFIVGNRRDFYSILIPHAVTAPRLSGGHVIMYDNPTGVAFHILKFLKSLE